MVLSGVLALIIYLWRHEVMISLAIGLALICVVLIAAVTGSMTPFVLKKLNQDPAHASGPFITMTNDVVGLTAYMVITTSILY